MIQAELGADLAALEQGPLPNQRPWIRKAGATVQVLAFLNFFTFFHVDKAIQMI